MLTLYFAPGSSSMAPHIALHEIGTPFESRPMSFARKDSRSPDYLAINPAGKVPTLLIDGRALTEVAGILFYLARRFPERIFCPRTASKPKRRWFRGCPSSHQRSILRAGKASNTQGNMHRTAETKSGRREWAVGRYSIADSHLFGCICALPTR